MTEWGPAPADEAPGFSDDYRIGTTFGPGSRTRTCLVCGAVVLDDVAALGLHEAWHRDHEGDDA